MENDRRFIEESFPVKEVSRESAREKNIRHGHISTLHVWWARRPLASSRATNYAALISAPSDSDDWNKTNQFIATFSEWENSNNPQMIKKARNDVLKTNKGIPPRVLDPFAGGGAIPLEALRLGCEVYASDYNPIATLLLKCTLEYPQKYGQTKKVKDKWGVEQIITPLLEDVKKWGNWVLHEVRQELDRFYPSDPDGSIPVAYIWARTIPCQNPSCGTEIPLMHRYWLANKSRKKIALYPYVQGKSINFKIVGTGYEPIPAEYDPESGSVSRAIVTCAVCGAVIDDKITRKLFIDGKTDERLVAVALNNNLSSGKTYRIATKADVDVFNEAKKHLRQKRSQLLNEWGMDPIPDEPLPLERAQGSSGFRVILYGMKTWGDLFNSRQQLMLMTFVEYLRKACKIISEQDDIPGYSTAVISYLAMAFDRLLTRNSNVCVWHNGSEQTEKVFALQALPMQWSYPESNPLEGESVTGYAGNLKTVISVIENLLAGPHDYAYVNQANSMSIPFQDGYFDAIFSDPPYYDNVAYADLSDFFYVWIKRTFNDLFPDLFITPLTPKSDEIIQDPARNKDSAFFQNSLGKAFHEMHRVLKDAGIAVIVYAYKSTMGWETLINALLDSGLVITGCWPLSTELDSRLNARETASLASSIYIVARKLKRDTTGFYNKVQNELKEHLNKRLSRLWEEGIGGADFFIAAIGSAIEIFGKYEKVLDYEGNVVRADRLLDDVRKIATDYAVHQILHNGFAGEVSDLTRFYVLYRWDFSEAKVEFDEARKLAQSCGIDLAREWNRNGFIKKDKEFIRVVGPQNRDLDDLKDSHELIDILHAALLLWEKGRRDDMVKLLHTSGFGKGDVFYRVAQAISETLPLESKEKKLLDGFLSGRERLREEVIKQTRQGRLI